MQILPCPVVQSFLISKTPSFAQSQDLLDFLIYLFLVGLLKCSIKLTVYNLMEFNGF